MGASSRVARQDQNGFDFATFGRSLTGAGSRIGSELPRQQPNGCGPHSGGRSGMLIKAAGGFIAQARLGIQAIEALTDGPQFIENGPQ
jgi:hypothetical protein